MKRRGLGEGVVSAVAIGGILIIAGLVFLSTPDLGGKIVAFFSDITTRPLNVASGNSTLSLPVPASVGSHAVFYSAVGQFCLGVAILEIFVLALRLGLDSRVGRIAETIGNLVFWGSAAYLVPAFLNSGTTYSGWFSFWGLLIVVVGVSIIVRGVILLAKRHDVTR